MRQAGRFLDGAGALICAGLAFALLARTPEPVQVDQGSTAQGAETALEPLEVTLEALDAGELDEVAKEIADAQGLQPAANTCGMRHPRLMPYVPREARRLYAAAALATTPEAKARLLEQAGEDAPQARWRAEIGLAQLALRRENAEEALRHAEAALAHERIPEACRADVAYTRSLAMADQASVEAALVAAIEADPAFWDARFDLSVTLAREIDTASTPGRCAERAAMLVRSVVMLDHLARSDVQLTRLEGALGPETSVAGAARALLLGLVYERSDRAAAARAVYETGLRDQGRRDCAGAIRLALDHRLAALSGTNEGKR